MAGANRSDVLKSPGQSIPMGTLSAILTTTTVYIAFVWLFGSAFAHTTLTDERYIITVCMCVYVYVCVCMYVCMYVQCIDICVCMLQGKQP